jgi:hypothetical protein
MQSRRTCTCWPLDLGWSQPGNTDDNDTAAARIWNIFAILEEAGLLALGDMGYHDCDETRQRIIAQHNEEEATVAEGRQPHPATRNR